MNDIDRCERDIIVRGLVDWINASEVHSVALELGGASTHEEARNLSLDVVARLLRKGLMEAGDVTEAARGFVAWGIPVESALVRIKEGWSKLPANPGLGDICWLKLTDVGRQEAS